MIRVLLAERAPLIGAALAALLAQADDIDVVAALDTVDDLVLTVLTLRPDAAVIDINGGSDERLAAVGELHERVPECRTVLLTGYREPGSLRRAMAVQGWGLVGKDATAGDLLEAIRSVVKGERFVEPAIAAAVRHFPDSPLTVRETEMLRLAAEGIPAAEIATAVSLAAGTVRNYLRGINAKFGARNLIDAVRIAREAGWL
jgi:two-component system response regulator DesR